LGNYPYIPMSQSHPIPFKPTPSLALPPPVWSPSSAWSFQCPSPAK
jgi:hypothetical protein